MKIKEMRQLYDRDFNTDKHHEAAEYEEFLSNVLISLPALWDLAEYARQSLKFDKVVDQKRQAILLRHVIELF